VQYERAASGTVERRSALPSADDTD
jgi:hypothetical protein